jgi:hypothetical protein
MEQPCYKCGQAVEEGVPFCPHCGAPQIRVVLAQPPVSPAAFTDAGATAQATAALRSPSVPALTLPLQWSNALQPCALAAFFGALAMVLKLMVPLIAGVAAGFFAVALYRRRNPDVAVFTGIGARLGALCGFFCSGMTAILGALRVAILHQGDEIRRAMLDAVQQAASRYPDPQAQPGLDFMRSSPGLFLMLACLFFFGFLLLLLLGTLGGALGGAILGRRDRP